MHISNNFYSPYEETPEHKKALLSNMKLGLKHLLDETDDPVEKNELISSYYEISERLKTIQ